jgi:hypothetical protein
MGLAVWAARAAAAPLWAGTGMVNTRAGGDAPFLVQRVYELARDLQAGAIPARWMPDAAYGLGYPAFNYYAALPYYLAALLHLFGLGILTSIKLTQTVGFVAAGLFTYRLARRIGARPGGGLLASAAYTLAPFHLVNVYVRGDALSEFWAMALIPGVLWALLELRHNLRASRLATLSMLYALLVLSHNISALVFSPILGLWLLAEAVGRGARGRRFFWHGAVALILGLALSAWFWVPALRETALVQLGEQTTGYFNYAGHFRGADLIQWRLIHDYTVGARDDPFDMALWQVGLAAAGLVALWLRLRRNERPDRSEYLAAVLFAATTWLITPASRALWDTVPLLPYVQFPWRFLGLQALAIALLSAPLADWAGGRLRGAGGIAVAVAVVAGLGAMSMAGLRLDRLPLSEAEITPQRLMLYETYSNNIGTTIRGEYLPREMVPRPYTSAVQLNGGVKPAPLALEGALESATAVEIGPQSEAWRSPSPSPAAGLSHDVFPRLAGHRGRPGPGVESLEGLGLIGLRLEKGTHEVTLRLGSTLTRSFSMWVSSVAALLWLALACYPLRNSTRARRHLLLAVAIAAAAGFWLLGVPRTATSEVPAGPQIMDFSRAPYLHAEPEGVDFGALHLDDYTLSATTAHPGETVTLALDWAAAVPDAEVTVQLMAATAHLYDSAPTWLRVTQAVDAGETIIELELPDDLPPGLYVPRLKVAIADEEQTPTVAGGAGLGKLALQPLQVETAAGDTAAAHGVAADAEPLAQFGPENSAPVISLLRADGRQIDDDRLEMELVWRSEAQAPLNYQLSLRLYRPDGSLVKDRDLPPLLGGYPTSLWQPGEYSTTGSGGFSRCEALNGENTIEIVLYDRATLQAAGTARLPLTLVAVD